ncbi:MAG: oligoribonuclease [Fibrobacteraceae bacterium]|nr:oligoribonuclease [Fibrobacteraceae bacterium]
MAKSSRNLVWMDLEMSGLYPEKDVILEIATIVTDANLKVLAEGPVVAIHHTENIFESMDEWNSKHHSQSGLVDRCRHSRYTLADAEKVTLDFIKPFTEKGKNLLCGNSITQDRRFLYKYMPNISNWLCYRNVDVSSIKELCFRWYPNLPEFQKVKNHQALDDIRESIAELEYYRKTIFKDKV